MLIRNYCIDFLSLIVHFYTTSSALKILIKKSLYQKNDYLHPIIFYIKLVYKKSIIFYHIINKTHKILLIN